ncbi:hypothetical protein [Melittangium boletus]|uniref:Lipoprotein n=1 Tax=Melittangium boletus DSM 14713 TaxID=1294270 RepID=A0A250IF07_9BACT|nr:hypothetical protein [Melittangium boletus]ATB30424.1 hypothetical protein MEBOL_003885 [Melittangium boletus DSM 14713]
MKAKDLVFASILTLAGCSLLGRQGSPLVPLEDDPSIVFPEFFDRAPVNVGAPGSIHELDGEMLRALTVATQDFLPPESEDLPCALKREAQTYRIIRQGDVFFIYISENLAHCGHKYPALDSGVKYAISRDGRILRRRLDGQPEFPRETSTSNDGTWIQAEPGVSSPIEAYDNPILDGGTQSHSEADGGTGPDAG